MPFKEFTGEVVPFPEEKPKKFVEFTGDVAPFGTEVQPKKLVPFEGEVTPFDAVQKATEPVTISGRDQVTPQSQGGGFATELVKGIVGAGKGLIEGLPQTFKMEYGSRKIGTAQRQLEQFERVDKGEIKRLTDETAPAPELENYIRATPEQRAKLKAQTQGQLQEGFTDVKEANRLYTQFQKDVAKYRGKTPDLTDIENVQDFSNWLGYNLGAGAVNLAPVMMSAVVGGAPGALFTGTGLAYQETLGNRLEALEKKFRGKDATDEQVAQRIADYLRESRDVNAMVALASGALDMAGPVGSILRKKFAKDLGQEAVRYESRKEAAKAAVKEVPREIIEEAATGAGQEITQIAGERALDEQTGDIFSKSNVKRVVNAAAAEAAGALSGSGVNVASALGRQELQQRTDRLAREELARQTRQEQVARGMEVLGPQFNQLVQSFRDQGLSEANAIREAGALISQGGFDRELLGLEPGADRTGVPDTSDRGREGVATEPATPAGGRLDDTGQPAAVPPTGEGALQPTLTPEESERLFAELEQDATDNYPPDVAERIVSMASEAVLDGANPQFAFSQAINTVTEEVTGVEPTAIEPTRVEPTLGTEPAAIEPTRIEPTFGAELPELAAPEIPAPAALPTVTTGEQPAAPATLETPAPAAIPTAPSIEQPTAVETPPVPAVPAVPAAVTPAVTEPAVADAPTTPVAAPEPIRFDPSTNQYAGGLRPGDEVSDGTNNFVVTRRSGFTLELDRVNPDGTRTGVARSVDPTSPEFTGDLYRTGGSETTMQPKGKRGRKPVERTPEQQAQYEEERRAQQGALRDAVRVAERATRTVEAPFDETAYDTPEALNSAIEARMNENTDALTQAYRIANNPRFRKNKAGQVARQLIESNNFTPRQHEIAQNRAKREPEIAKSELLESTNPEVDTGLAEFDGNNAAAAMGYIAATGNPFERLLANRLRPFLRNVQIVVVTSPSQLPNDPVIRREIQTANGLYVERKGKQFIYLNAQEGFSGLSNTVLLHEALHGATMAKLNAWVKNRNSVDPATRKAIDDLQKVMLQAYKYYAVLNVAGKTDQTVDRLFDVGAFTDIKEFVAYGLTQPEMQDFLMQVPETNIQLERGALTKFVESIMRMFGIPVGMKNAFQDLVIVTDQILQTPRVKLSGETVVALAKRISRIDKLKQKLELSNKATDINRSIGDLILQTRSFKDALKLLRAAYPALKVDSIRKILPTLTTDDITRWVGNKLANLKNVNEAVQEMAAMRTRMIRDFAEKIPAWVDFSQNNEQQGRLLGDLMNLSTLPQVQVDPTLFPDLNAALQGDAIVQQLTRQLNDPNTPAASKPSIKGNLTKRKDSLKLVYDQWAQLAPKGKEIYEMVKDQYRKTFEFHEQLLMDKIAQSNIPGDINDASTPKGRLMASITQSFQEAKQLGLYFPLMRYGNYWLRVGPSKSPNSEFYMFESATARNMFMANRVEEMRKAGDKRSQEEMIADMDLDMGDTLDGMRGQVVDSSLMLKNIFGLLDQNPLSDIEAVKDQIYQMYLMTLPEKDIRKRFTHRQGKTGFSGDVIRNFIVSQHTAANQLSRLAYADQVRNYIGASYAELAGNPDKLKLSTFIDEVAIRATAELQPTYSAPGDINWDKIATVGNQAVFFYLLTAPKSALVQMTQLPVVGIPTLTAEFGGVDVAKVVARYMNLYRMMGTSKTDAQGNVITEWGAPSVNDSGYIANHPNRAYRDVLKRAWAYANDRNIFMETYAGDMTNRGRAPTATYEGPLRKGTRATLNFISGGFHHAERISREIMYMSSFELAFADAKKRGKNDQAAFNEATERAVKIVYDSLFNYTQYNKPRVMKHPVGKVAFQFFTFPLQMTSYLVRNFYGMLPLLNKEEKRDAAIKFFGTIGMTGLFAGTVGLPMYSMVMGIAEGIREFLRPDMDDEEADEYYDEDDDGNPLGKRSLDLWFREWFLPHYFGPDSSLANAMGLTDEQAQTLTRAVKMGPISAYTDLNIGSSVSLDGLWFRNEISAETSKDAFMQMAFNFFGGALASSASQILSAYDDFRNGDMTRGWEKLSPAFFRGAVKATRLREEGLRTPSGDQVMDPEFYTTAKLIGESTGFGSTTAAEIQKSNILAKRVYKEAQQKKEDLLNKLDKAAQAYADNMNEANEQRLEDVLTVIEKHNYKNGMIAPISGKTASKSIQERMERRGRAFQGLSVPKKAEGLIYPLVEKSRTQ